MTLVASRTCKCCGVEKVLTEFPLKTKRDDPNPRHDAVCTACRIAFKKEKRDKVKFAQKQTVPNIPSDQSKGEVSTSPAPQNQSNSADEPIYKKFVYPDGRVLSLTKSQFDQIVSVFRDLINSKRRQEGKPLLLGGD